MGKTVMVLGGGVGGVVAASRLRKLLARAHRVVRVEPEADHLFQPSLLWLMLGRRRPEQIARPVARLARRGIEVVRGTVERIDPARRAVTVNGSERPADYLVIALGAKLAPETVPGLQQSGHNLFRLADARAVHDALAAFRWGRAESEALIG